MGSEQVQKKITPSVTMRIIKHQTPENPLTKRDEPATRQIPKILRRNVDSRRT
jgi:hypothetical protein